MGAQHPQQVIHRIEIAGRLVQEVSTLVATLRVYQPVDIVDQH
jgi:hypothetical protein